MASITEYLSIVMNYSIPEWFQEIIDEEVLYDVTAFSMLLWISQNILAKSWQTLFML